MIELVQFCIQAFVCSMSSLSRKLFYNLSITQENTSIKTPALIIVLFGVSYISHLSNLKNHLLDEMHQLSSGSKVKSYRKENNLKFVYKICEKKTSFGDCNGKFKCDKLLN